MKRRHVTQPHAQADHTHFKKLALSKCVGFKRLLSQAPAPRPRNLAPLPHNVTSAAKVLQRLCEAHRARRCRGARGLPSSPAVPRSATKTWKRRWRSGPSSLAAGDCGGAASARFPLPRSVLSPAPSASWGKTPTHQNPEEPRIDVSQRARKIGFRARCYPKEPPGKFARRSRRRMLVALPQSLLPPRRPGNLRALHAGTRPGKEPEVLVELC